MGSCKMVTRLREGFSPTLVMLFEKPMVAFLLGCQPHSKSKNAESLHLCAQTCQWNLKFSGFTKDFRFIMIFMNCNFCNTLYKGCQ